MIVILKEATVKMPFRAKAEKEREETPLLEIHSGIMLKGEMSMAKNVLLTGKFEGDLRTTGCLTVAEGGAILGSIEAGALVLEPGNLVEAKVKVGSPTPPKGMNVIGKIGSGKWSSRLQKLKELAFGWK